MAEKSMVYRDRSSDVYEFSNDWKVKLIGTNGFIVTKAWPLALHSRFYRSVIKDQVNFSEVSEIILPDFTTTNFRDFVTLLECGSASGDTERICELGDLVEVFGLNVEGLFCLETAEETVDKTATSDASSVPLVPKKEIFSSEGQNKNHNTNLKDQAITSHSGNAVSFSTSIDSIEEILICDSDDENDVTAFIDDDPCDSNDTSVSNNNTFVASDDDDRHASNSDEPAGKRLRLSKGFLRLKTKTTDISTIQSIPDKYTCKICSKHFAVKQGLSMHTLIHYKESSLCKICKKIFTDVETKINHDCIIDPNIQTYKCHHCDKTYGEESIMLVHRQQHLPDRNGCPLCTKQLGSLPILLRHVRMHKNEIGNHLEACLPFSRNEIKGKTKAVTGNQHVQSATESLQCIICSEEFLSGLEKVNHDCKLKSNVQQFKCDICGKIYGENCVMLVHRQQHLREKRFKCPICSQSIPPILHLIAHVRKHTLEFQNREVLTVNVSETALCTPPVTPSDSSGDHSVSPLLKAQETILSHCLTHLNSSNNSVPLGNNTNLPPVAHSVGVQRQVSPTTNCSIQTGPYHSALDRHTTPPNYSTPGSSNPIIPVAATNSKRTDQKQSNPIANNSHAIAPSNYSTIDRQLATLNNHSIPVRHPPPNYHSIPVRHPPPNNQSIPVRHPPPSNSSKHVRQCTPPNSYSNPIQQPGHPNSYSNHVKLTTPSNIYSNSVRLSVPPANYPSPLRQHAPPNNYPNSVRQCVDPNIYCNPALHSATPNNYSNPVQQSDHPNSYSNHVTYGTPPIMYPRAVVQSAPPSNHSNPVTLPSGIQSAPPSNYSNPGMLPTLPNNYFTAIRQPNNYSNAVRNSVPSNNYPNAAGISVPVTYPCVPLRFSSPPVTYPGHTGQSIPIPNYSTPPAIIDSVAQGSHLSPLIYSNSTSQATYSTTPVYNTVSSTNRFVSPIMKQVPPHTNLPVYSPNHAKSPDHHTVTRTTPPTNINHVTIMPEPHSCSNCKERFMKRSRLIAHEQKHKLRSEQVCPICQKWSPTIKNAVVHIDMHFGCTFNTGERSCGLCNAVFANDDDFLQHRQSHKLDYECPVCPISSSELSTLLRHVCETHSNEFEGTKECRLCKKTFVTIGEVLLHMQLHVDPSLVTCPLCAQKFNNELDAVFHINCHYGTVDLKCKKCFSEFPSVHETYSHEMQCTQLVILGDEEDQIQFDSRKALRCPTCKKAFMDKNRLCLHEQIHRNKSELECPFCDVEFLSQCEALKHVASHKINTL